MGWQDLWQDPKVRARWEAMPPLQEVVDMAGRLEAEGGRRDRRAPASARRATGTT